MRLGGRHAWNSASPSAFLSYEVGYYDDVNENHNPTDYTGCDNYEEGTRFGVTDSCYAMITAKLIGIFQNYQQQVFKLKKYISIVGRKQ